ncbi:antibiotic biosynthesis monooxygenase [Mesorhizobium sp. WSM4906]|uniref:antibiotic biosynthesis monooxygenase family protein n=1 Tax=Mesorhizobium sp. WSM4906 TaxID=3038546 RepID=UPI002416C043|nr:antibiotic biosynthesis monooxygenase [Mesorhizobium sp. WSM4906]WFP78040.1 antibiotic biosynthesis monooxygenase [Mesorhizobium sp. WSM4906]
MTETLEIVSFRLKPEAAADFVAQNGAVTDWLARQPGFLSHHLGKREDGGWIDVVRWQSREQALAAAGRIMAEIGDCEAMRAIEPASVEMRHAAVALSRFEPSGA